MVLEWEDEYAQVYPGAAVRYNWLGETVVAFAGPVHYVARQLPTFERRPFATQMPPKCEESSSQTVPLPENRYYDAVVRLPQCEGDHEVPVGIVTKRYTLVQHKDLLETAIEDLCNARVPKDSILVEVTTTEYGSRILLRLAIMRMWSDPGSSVDLAPCLHIVNSVERSTSFSVKLGWYDPIAHTSLLVDQGLLTFSHLAFRSTIREAMAFTAESWLRESTEQEQGLHDWAHTKVTDARLEEWVDGPLRKRWGVTAAARVFHVATTGKDGSPHDPPRWRYPDQERFPPHRKELWRAAGMEWPLASPGSALVACQALAWVARQRRDVETQIRRLTDIPTLMGELLGDTDTR